MRAIPFSLRATNRPNERLQKDSPRIAVCFVSLRTFNFSWTTHISTQAWAMYTHPKPVPDAYRHTASKQAICRPFAVHTQGHQLVVYAWCWPHFAPRPGVEWGEADFDKIELEADAVGHPSYKRLNFKLKGRVVKQLKGDVCAL